MLLRFTAVDAVFHFYAVCSTIGYLMSYWNRPHFPELCSDPTMDDSEAYDTMVRVAGTYVGISHAFKVVADIYGWTHIVLLSDDNTEDICWYGAKPFADVFGNNVNYTFTWLRFGSEPTDKELDDLLRQIRSRTRGYYRAISFFAFETAAKHRTRPVLKSSEFT